MKHKYTHVLALLGLLAACHPTQQEIEPTEEPPAAEQPYGDLIGTYFVEGRNLTLSLYDITSLYKDVCYIGWSVPVLHTRYESLPVALKETVKSYGLSSGTQVYSMQWKGETVYHLICRVREDNTGVYRSSGERVRFENFEDYLQFLQEISDIHCLLVMNTEVVKNAEGAPNMLPGTWQMDWKHLHHDISPTNSGTDEQVTLYDGLPFSITEICHFEADGTGYLRSVKTYKNGQTEVACDPFKYWLTDYQTDETGYQGYSYVCRFEAGDIIEYTARSHDGFEKVFDRVFTFVTYPWYRTKTDPYANEQGSPKYGNPGKDSESPLVGRWTGEGVHAANVFGIQRYTWVFRKDGTGYLLSGRQMSEAFAYTLEGNLLTIYKYDTGFFINDGFWKDGDHTYSFVPEPTPEGKVITIKIDGNRLELEGWNNTAADLSRTPIEFTRVTI